jgi:hypothetical protein
VLIAWLTVPTCPARPPARLPSPPVPLPAVCNSATFRTCMDTMLFGLPAPHWCYVQYIKAG